MDVAEAADIAQRLRHDAVELEIGHVVIGLCFWEIAQVTLSCELASCEQGGSADQGDAPLRLDVRVFLIVCDEADARIMLDVLGVFRQRADEDEQAAVVIHQIRRDGAERVAVEFFRQGAQALFRSAFAEQVSPADRVKILERVVKEQADSLWADDALWVLGAAARRQGLSTRVVYYWQFLISRWPAAHLEDYTRTLDVYRLSPASGIQRVLEAEGRLYVPQPGHVISGKDASAFVYNNAVAFNPVPMLVWEGLGDCYSELAKPDLAASAYAKVLAAAPAEGQWTARAGGRGVAPKAAA